MVGVSPRAAGLAALALIVFAAGASGAARSGPAPAAAAAAAPAGPAYVSLARDEVNARRGPGLEHRIDWVYARRGLPLEVVGESGDWRRVRDPDGAETWMRTDSLSPQRTVYVRGDAIGTTALRAKPKENGRVLAYLSRGVVGRLSACAGGYRLVKVGAVEGWVAADALWAADACPAV